MRPQPRRRRPRWPWRCPDRPRRRSAARPWSGRRGDAWARDAWARPRPGRPPEGPLSPGAASRVHRLGPLSADADPATFGVGPAIAERDAPSTGASRSASDGSRATRESGRPPPGAARSTSLATSSSTASSAIPFRDEARPPIHPRAFRTARPTRGPWTLRVSLRRTFEFSFGLADFRLRIDAI